MWNKYQGLIFVISGPSGSGKTTLLSKLLEDRDLKAKLSRPISFTTRKARSGERQGRDYFFISEAEFKRLRRANKLLEWTRYLGYYYATSKEYIAQAIGSGKSLALCLDLKGASRMRKIFPKNSRLIFVLPPSLEDLKCRIEGRCNRTKQEEIARRLELAEAELASAGLFDYTIVNKNFNTAHKQLKKIVIANLKAQGKVLLRQPTGK